MLNKYLFKRALLLGVILVANLLATGCASITRGTKDELQVVSDPPGAQVTLSNGQTGKTPVTFTLPRKKGVVVEVSKPGYEPQTVIVSSKFAGAGGAALAGNVLVGGLIGAGIDGLSGATLSLKPNPVSVALVPVAPPDSGEAEPAASDELAAFTLASGAAAESTSVTHSAEVGHEATVATQADLPQTSSSD